MSVVSKVINKYRKQSSNFDKCIFANNIKAFRFNGTYLTQKGNFIILKAGTTRVAIAKSKTFAEQFYKLYDKHKLTTPHLLSFYEHIIS